MITHGRGCAPKLNPDESDPKVSVDGSQLPNCTSREAKEECPGISTAEAGIFEGGGSFVLAFGLCCNACC